MGSNLCLVHIIFYIIFKSKVDYQFSAIFKLVNILVLGLTIVYLLRLEV